MEGSYKGRVTELWQDSEQAFIELVIGPDRHVLKANHADLLKAIGRGDLVSVSANHAREIIRIDRIGGPSHSNWSPLADSMRWRRTTGEPTRMFRLQQRQKTVAAIREDLTQSGFLEIETPLLVKGTCPDTHIESIPAGEGYLVTSTEYQIKRLIVGGFENVFTLTRNFRANDRGRYHSTEFTMLEWARAYGSLDDIEVDAVRLIRSAFQRIHPGCTSLNYLGNKIDFMAEPWEKLTVRDAFRQFLGLKDVRDFSLQALLDSSKESGIELPSDFQKDQHLLLSYLLDRVQPNLGKKTPTFLREWPVFMTSSAQVSLRDPHVAERSELYIAGIEISDGFPFLCDSEMQKSTFERELERRREEGKASVRVDDLYIQALAEGIPPGAGMALGVDRLVMVLTGASQLADVQAFSWDET